MLYRWSALHWRCFETNNKNIRNSNPQMMLCSNYSLAITYEMDPIRDEEAQEPSNDIYCDTDIIDDRLIEICEIILGSSKLFLGVVSSTFGSILMTSMFSWLVFKFVSLVLVSSISRVDLHGRQILLSCSIHVCVLYCYRFHIFLKRLRNLAMTFIVILILSMTVS
jgi:hypothetical protein